MEGKPTEQSHIGYFAVRRNPTLHDLLAVEFPCLTLTALTPYLRHSDNLKTLAGGYYAEISGFILGSSAGVLHLEFRSAIRATATCECVAKIAFQTLPNVSAVGAGHYSAICAIGEMLKAVVVSPLFLCGGYGAQCGG
jgi:hypothetical protein